MQISDLVHIDPQQTAVFGGKAGGLVRLISYAQDSVDGKVPPGFAVSLSHLPNRYWPEAVREEFIYKVKLMLVNGRVAVRSSAGAEDSAEQSFAGMFESVLHIRNIPDALAAADHCIASGNSPRVHQYAGSTAAIPVGLVVQQQVEATAAGVCFTIDPVGKDGAVVIEAVPGLGHQLVGGRVEPLRFRVYYSGKNTWIPFENDRELPGASKTGEANEGSTVGGAGDTTGHITGAEITRIAAAAKKLEAQFGHPLDLEWAIDKGGTLWWLQARPVTAAAAPPAYIIQRSYMDVDDGPITVWSNWNVRETMPRPLYPFTWSFWRDKLLPVITAHLMGIPAKSPLLPHVYSLDLVHGRIYFNLNAMLAAPLMGWLSPRLISTVDARAGSTLKALRRAGVLVPRKYPGAKWLLFFPMVKASFISFLKVLRYLNPEKAMNILAVNCWAIAGRTPLESLGDRELIDEWNLWAKPEMSRVLYGLQMELVAMVVYRLAKKAFKHFPQAVDLLCTGIQANPTTKISLAIETLVEQAEPFKHLFLDRGRGLSTGELLQRLEKEPGGSQWLASFHSFLAEYGHRGPMEFDLGSIRWSDDPSMILDSIGVALREREGAKESLAKRMQRLAEKRQNCLAEAIAAAPWWKRWFMRCLARDLERYMPLREAPKHYAVIVFQRIRRAALELGGRLEKKGILDRVDDVFFLEMRELEAIVLEGAGGQGWQERIAERKQLYNLFLQEVPPSFYRSDGVPVLEALAEPAPFAFAEGVQQDGEVKPLLRGTPISAGVTAGRVCILTEPDPRQVEEGDILVMEYADPGWTPLFPRAAGVVMEVGGLMCHAAVVAREIGVPAVFGVTAATRVLKTGQRVTIDGSKGTVTLAG